MTSQAAEQPRIPPLRAVIMDGDALRLLTTGVNEWHGDISPTARLPALSWGYLRVVTWARRCLARNAVRLS
jgi:hypothetical protein